MTASISKFLLSWLFIDPSEHHYTTQTSKFNNFLIDPPQCLAMSLTLKQKTNKNHFKIKLSLLPGPYGCVHNLCISTALHGVSVWQWVAQIRESCSCWYFLFVGWYHSLVNIYANKRVLSVIWFFTIFFLSLLLKSSTKNKNIGVIKQKKIK